MELNRHIFIAEAIVLAAPSSALVALGVSSISIRAGGQFWPMGAGDLLIVIAAIATLSGWRLLRWRRVFTRNASTLVAGRFVRLRAGCCGNSELPSASVAGIHTDGELS